MNIFGYFDMTAINIHYYYVFIPYDTDNIYIEIHGHNILGFCKEGITQINTYRITGNTIQLFEECKNKMIIKIKKKKLD